MSGNNVVDYVKGKLQCNFCHKPGHIAKVCRKRLSATSGSPDKEDVPKTEQLEKKASADAACKNQDQKVPGMRCFNCGGKGHMARSCPSNSYFCTDAQTISPEPQHRETHRKPQGVARSGTVEGTSVDNILLDTGCSRTLVRRDLVPEDRFLEGEAVTIRCAHGDTVLYPLARVTLEMDGRHIVTEAAVSETLPVAVLLGTDVPELPQLLGTELIATGEELVADAMAVSTRGQTKRRETEQKTQEEKDAASGAITTTLGATSREETQPTRSAEDSAGPVGGLGVRNVREKESLEGERAYKGGPHTHWVFLQNI